MIDRIHFGAHFSQNAHKFSVIAKYIIRPLDSAWYAGNLTNRPIQSHGGHQCALGRLLWRKRWTQNDRKPDPFGRGRKPAARQTPSSAGLLLRDHERTFRATRNRKFLCLIIRRSKRGKIMQFFAKNTCRQLWAHFFRS